MHSTGAFSLRILKSRRESRKAPPTSSRGVYNLPTNSSRTLLSTLQHGCLAKKECSRCFLAMSPPVKEGEERRACLSVDAGFHIRHPPPPHDLESFLTEDGKLFQTIHMGTANVDRELWRLNITGLVQRPYSLTLPELQALPSATVMSFHECYGSPLKAPTEAVWRVGNVTWTGVRVSDLLKQAVPLPEATYVWSDGLDGGTFAMVEADRYRKDLPISKAQSPEVLVAYEMNGLPLDKQRGGPVRLVVPGWFGTNSTKWLAALTLTKNRATGPFTTTFYNELVPGRTDNAMRPVWSVEPNAIIVRPTPGEDIKGQEVEVWGWAWSADGIEQVSITSDSCDGGYASSVQRRVEFEWQKFTARLTCSPGFHAVTARATSRGGCRQPLIGRRNHVHTVAFRTH